MKKSNKTLFTIIVLLICVFLVIAGAEIICQVSFLQKLRYWGEFVPDKDLAWTIRPNASFEVEWYPGIKQTITTNELGLRETKNPSEIDHNKTVVMLQGDSNIMGYGIQQNELISKRLAQKLQNVEVVNAATSGYDLQHYVLQMKKLHDLYRPDYNFVIFNMNNDYLGSLLSTSYLVSRPYYDLVDGELLYRNPEFRVPAQMFGLHYVKSLAAYDKIIAPYMARKKRVTLSGIWGQSYLAYEVGIRLIARGYWDKIYGKPKDMYSDAEYNRARMLLTYFKFLKDWPEPYITGNRLISKLFGSYNKYKDVKTVVVLLPTRAEIINPEETIRTVAKLTDGKEDVSFDKFYEMLEGIFNKTGLEYINLRKDFLKSPNRDGLYLKGNEHITPAAHELIAGRIADYLKKSIN